MSVLPRIVAEVEDAAVLGERKENVPYEANATMEMPCAIAVISCIVTVWM